MHKALQTNDVLRETFIHIRHDVPSPEHRKDAYHAALVCRRFLPHALDALWFSMDSIRPLLALIPNSEIIKEDKDSLALNGILQKADLVTFDLYAHRVQEFNQIRRSRSLGLHVAVIMDLLHCLERRYLFPNLRSLWIHPGRDELGNVYCFFLCPNLETLEIFQGLPMDLRYFLPRLVQAAPSLRHFKTVHVIPQNLVHLTSHLPGLQSLDSWNSYHISTDSFSSSIPFSEHITTLCAGSLYVEPSESLPATIQFPALTSLELMGHQTAGELSLLFSHSLFPKLKEFAFNSPPYLYRPETSGLYKETWLTLCSLLFTKQLDLLYIRQDEDDINNPVEETQIALEDFFANVKTPCSLTTFWMAEPKLLKPLTNSSIDRLCKAMPKLTHLYLHLYDSALASFNTVALLAQRLPQLNSLDIGINGSLLADPPAVPILSHRLATLCLQNSRIENPLLFARYIDRLFPFCTIESTPLPDKGEKVVSAVKLVRDCRKDQIVRSLQEHNE